MEWGTHAGEVACDTDDGVVIGDAEDALAVPLARISEVLDFSGNSADLIFIL